MFRQMLHGVSTSKAIGQLKNEGFYLLYRGVLPPLAQKSLSVAVMFGTYDFYRQEFSQRIPSSSVNPLVPNTLAACCAGVSEALLFCPFERIQTLMQDRNYNSKLQNTAHAVHLTRRDHGVKEFYRGLNTIMIRNALSNSIFFYARDRAQIFFKRKDEKRIWAKYLGDFVSGGVIGAGINTLFYPLNVVKTRMQSNLGGEFKSIKEVFKIVFVERNGSWSKIYRGVHLNYTRSLLSWGIINASYEFLKTLLD